MREWEVDRLCERIGRVRGAFESAWTRTRRIFFATCRGMFSSPLASKYRHVRCCGKRQASFRYLQFHLEAARMQDSGVDAPVAICLGEVHVVLTATE